MKKISAIVISCLLCLQAYGQHVLKVTLKDVLPYDSLKCNVRVSGIGSSIYTGQYGQEARTKPYGDGFLTYTFSTPSADVAYSWHSFWDAAGWFTTITAADDGTDPPTYYRYA